MDLLLEMHIHLEHFICLIKHKNLQAAQVEHTLGHPTFQLAVCAHYHMLGYLCASVKDRNALGL